MHMNRIRVDKCRKSLKKNEYLHNTVDVFDRFRIYLLQKFMCIPDKDILETGLIYLLYCKDFLSHSHTFF